MPNLSVFKELFFKTLHFGALIALGNVVVTYGSKILPERLIRKIADKRNNAIQNYLQPIVAKSLQSYSHNIDSKYDKTTVPIWTCWLQGENNLPEIPRICINSMRKNSGGHPVIVISLDNYTDYVQIAPHIVEKYNRGQIKNCHFADILRINILAQRGGVWLDATMLCTESLNSRFFDSEFHTIKLKPFGNFVSQCRWAVYCLSAYPNNKLFVLLQRMFEIYLTNERYFVDYFMFDQFISMLYDQDLEIRKMIDEVPFSNQNIMDLAKIINKEFSKSTWLEMTKSTSLFKLNWRTNLYNGRNMTFYEYLTNHLIKNEAIYHNTVL
jgi:hypothetical protein